MTAGRNSAESETLIGAFIGAVAIRTRLEDGLTFKQLLQRVREVKPYLCHFSMLLGAWVHFTRLAVLLCFWTID